LWRRVWRALSQPSHPMTDLVVLLGAAAWPIFVDSFLHSALFAVGNGGALFCWFILVLVMASDQHGREQSPGHLSAVPPLTCRR